MTLKTCQKCKKEISLKATHCQYCGTRQKGIFFDDWLLIIFFGIAVCLVLISFIPFLS